MSLIRHAKNNAYWIEWPYMFGEREINDHIGNVVISELSEIWTQSLVSNSVWLSIDGEFGGKKSELCLLLNVVYVLMQLPTWT